jgi:hypothetical protein
VPFGWVTADKAYGQVNYLRVWPEQHDCPHVLTTNAEADEVIDLSLRAAARWSATSRRRLLLGDAGVAE